MGKNNKGKGKEKTEQKMEKKAAKRARKELAEKGEEDVQETIAQCVEKGKQLLQVREERCPPPSPRSNMTLAAHPDKEELIMFGGEYYTGKNMYMYNDLYYYNIQKNEWTWVISPNPPPPRSAHQAVVVSAGGGQMWMFGGEFTSGSQKQFHHYRDLWVLHLSDKRWEQIKISWKHGPSARSGHRMAVFRNQLILFGGFHNVGRDCKYHNDVWAFDLSSYTWSQLDPIGTPPSPRSGCILCPMLTGSRLMVYGGYSVQQVKKDVDQGTAYTDMFALQPEGKGPEGRPAKWRWVSFKQSGTKPSPRCSVSAVVAPGSRAVLFGGVQDEEEDEEQLEGSFFNDMFTVDLDKGHWFSVQLRGNKEAVEKKRRRKAEQKGVEDGSAMEVDEDDINMDMAEDVIDTLDLSAIGSGDSHPPAKTHNPEPTPSTSTKEESIFTVTIGPQSSKTSDDQTSSCAAGEGGKPFVPSPRMSPCMVVKGSVLYLFGGKYEVGNREVTYSDFYSLDLGKLDEWKTIVAEKTGLHLKWQESSSSDSDGNKGEEASQKKRGVKRGASDSDDDDSDEDEELTFEDAPDLEQGESQEDYFERTQDYWLQQARDIMESEGVQLSDRKLLKLAKEICEEVVSKQ